MIRAFSIRFVLAAVLATIAGLPADAQQVVSGVDKHGRTIIGGTPWTPPDPREPKVIYGTDDRIDVYQETDPVRLRLSGATCGLLDASDLTNNGNGTYTIATSAWTVGGLSGCTGEPFRTQPVAMFCTGFLVGDDIIATAGHCYDSSDVSGVRFVFGFQMLNSTTPVVTVPASNVYQGVTILGHQLVGDYDYTVVRVDRKVTAAGASPLPIRRSGTIPLDTPVGVIGHPAGLPQKIAFGANTKVYGNTNDGYFTSNLDTYGGNSGSPVFNRATGVVEGILVRGETDYIDQVTCFVSNVLPDGSAGEEVSKSTSFVAFVPPISGFSQSAYQCGATVSFRIQDTDAVTSSVTATLTTTCGDVENVTATDPDADRLFEGAIVNAVAPAISGDGILESCSVDTITLVYNSSTVGTASVDCALPSIVRIAASGISDTGFSVTVETSEPTTATVVAGDTCGGNVASATSSNPTTTNVLALQGLASCTKYYLTVYVSDEAGNTSTTAGGDCAVVRTYGLAPNSFTDTFEPAALPGWTHSASTGSDNWSMVASGHASSPTNVYRYSPGLSAVADASLVTPVLPMAEVLEFEHTYGFESGYDGAVIEYSTDGGTSWSDLGSRITQGGYSGTISSTYGNPLGGRMAWTGGSLGSMSTVRVNWAGISGTLRVRFRFASDTSLASDGWYIDDVRVYSLDPLCQTHADAQWLTAD